MVDVRRNSIRLGVALALTVVGLFEVLSLLQGVRSVRRLRARVADEAVQRVEAARPTLTWRVDNFTHWPQVKNLIPHNNFYNYGRM